MTVVPCIEDAEGRGVPGLPMRVVFILCCLSCDSMGRHKFALTTGNAAYLGCGKCYFEVCWSFCRPFTHVPL
jgi:hypothetical protein